MTVRQVLEAILSDKTPKLRYLYGRDGNWKQDGPHCAIGGAAYVMKQHSADRIARGLQSIKLSWEDAQAIPAEDMMPDQGWAPSLFSVVSTLNDTTNLSKQNIAKRLLRTLSEETLAKTVPLNR